jgi:hypothetical protein
VPDDENEVQLKIFCASDTPHISKTARRVTMRMRFN